MRGGLPEVLAVIEEEARRARDPHELALRVGRRMADRVTRWPRLTRIARLERDARIQQAHARGVSVDALSRSFGLTRRHVRRILGRT